MDYPFKEHGAATLSLHTEAGVEKSPVKGAPAPTSEDGTSARIFDETLFLLDCCLEYVDIIGTSILSYLFNLYFLIYFTFGLDFCKVSSFFLFFSWYNCFPKLY